MTEKYEYCSTVPRTFVQDCRCLTNVYQSLYQTLQTTEMNFEEPLGKQVFKSQSCNPLQSCSSLAIRSSLCTCRDISTFF